MARPFSRALVMLLSFSCFLASRERTWAGAKVDSCGGELQEGGSLSGRKLLLQPSVNHLVFIELRREHNPKEDHQRFRFRSGLYPLDIAAGTLLTCFAVLCLCVQWRRKYTGQPAMLHKDISTVDSVSSSHEVNSMSERAPGTPLRVPASPSRFGLSSPQLTRIGSVHLGMNQIMRATRNFSMSMKLGEGGFGTVFRAELPDGQVVAIKRGKKEHFEILNAEFSNEVQLLTKIEHRNLVKLLGFTEIGDERILIMEYVPNGTLRDHLDGVQGEILSFTQRLQIAIDIAHGLTYLHLYAEKVIIHRDVKSSNILLSMNMRAKVADFGFARAGPMETDQTHIVTKVKGTAGYLDPEYLKTYQLTPKSDVYSFGILLVEIISGRRPVDLKREAVEKITVRWAFKKYNEGDLKAILDPLLQEKVNDDILKRLLALAFQCAAPTRTDRPVMKEVVEQLWQIRKDYDRSIRRD